MKYGLWLRISIILLAFLFLAQLSVYAAEGEKPVRPGPAASWTPDTKPQGGRQGPTATWTKTGPNLPRQISGPNIETPNIETPTIPSQLELSPSQRAMIQPAAKPAAAQQPAVKQPAAQQPLAPQSPAADQGGVPIGNGQFVAPQYFPQGPVQQPVPISKIYVPPPPSFGQITPQPAGGVMSSVVGFLKDLGSSAVRKVKDYGSNLLDSYCDFVNDTLGIEFLLSQNAYSASTPVRNIQRRLSDDSLDLDEDSDLATFYNSLYDWVRGAELGNLASSRGFTPQMDSYLSAEDSYNFIFQVGFLRGVMDSDCDPDMYVVLYEELLKKLREAEEKLKKDKEAKARSKDLLIQGAAGTVCEPSDICR